MRHKDTDTLFEYETMVEQALRGVVQEALSQVVDYGLIEDHHFFITFHTDFPGVDIPDYLKEKYPEEMTIVLQYQFDDLIVSDASFEVTLSFNNVPERMVIPFDAITGFADPSVKFGLQFHVAIDDLEALDAEGLEGLDTPPATPKSGKASAADKPSAGKPDPARKKSGSSSGGGESGGENAGIQQDNVVRLDTFRKDKKD